MKVERIGVAGAGTMGAGIAQLACLGRYETFIHDPDSGALEKGEQRLRAALTKGAERGRWTSDQAANRNDGRAAIDFVVNMPELAAFQNRSQRVLQH